MELYELNYLLRILTSSLLGLFIGAERALSNKSASFRTFSLVSTASCIFTIVGLEMSKLGLQMTNLGNVDPTRISAQIVSGVGFVGAGIIYKDRKANSVEGITTAVMIWFSSALGMVCGMGNLELILICFVSYAFILFSGKILHILHGKKE